MFERLSSGVARPRRSTLLFVAVAVAIHLGIGAAILIGGGGAPPRPPADLSPLAGSLGVGTIQGSGSPSADERVWIPEEALGRIEGARVVGNGSVVTLAGEDPEEGEEERTLRLGRRYELVILYLPPAPELADSLPSDLEISAVRHAYLTGEGFRVEPLEPELKLVAPERLVEWRWWITPVREGVQTLRTEIQAVVTRNGQAGIAPVAALVTPVTVRSSGLQRLLRSIDGPWLLLMALTGAFFLVRWAVIKRSARRSPE